MSYKQLQLQPPEIRLLILRPAKPARKRKNDIIDCTLLHVLLEDDNLHKFKALSYSWGYPETTYPIRLNGAVHRVTQSLGSFLSRQRVESHQQQYLWVDALCINQDDIEEKKHQIGLMRTIYSRASELLVWLGDEIDGGRSGIETLADFEDFVGTGIRPAVPQESQMAKINDVLAREWFDRTWIVQEIVLGAHDEKSDRTWVISGGKRVSWIVFKECVGYLSKFNQLLRHQFPYIHKLMVLEGLRVKYSPLNTELARPLLWWVTKCRGQATSDSRDKIYGVLGIASDPQALSRFPADYNISASALFLQFTAFNLDSTRDLSILRQCQYQALEDLPSWVPDWSVSTKEHPLWNFLDEEDTTEEEFDLIEMENPDGILLIKQVPLHKSHYRAAAGSATKYNLRKTTLEIEGIMVGQITYIEPAFISDVKTRWQDSTRFMMQVSRCKAVQDALPEQPNPYGTKNGRTKAFWRALMADHGGDGQYRPLLFTYKDWLNLIPLDWEPAPCHITARPRGTYELIQDRAQYLMLGLSAFLKERKLTLGGRDWKDFEPTSLKDFPITEISKGFNEGVASGFGSEEFFECLLEYAPEYGPQEIRQHFEALHDFTSMRTSLPENKDAEEERARMLADMNALATEWEAAGPYDLVNSPFYLPSAIPDRYNRHRPDPVFEFEVADAHPRELAVMADVAEKKVRVTRLDSDAKEVTGKVGREKYALGRRFFVMGGEGYMGLAPPLAEKGDIIAVLLGGDVPFILRPVEGTASFRLVGEAHVQGIMDGEVMKRLADGQCNSQSFQLV